MSSFIKISQPKTSQVLSIFVALVMIFSLSMYLRMGEELIDDGAFFLRYAENMQNWKFWVWNAGELPVWGASAPLWPLLIAVPMAIGISPEASLIGIGMLISSISLAAITLYIADKFSFLSSILFVILVCLDSNLAWFSIGGLESPLSIALIAFSIFALTKDDGGRSVGIAAGLLMVNKLDLLPIGLLLLFAYWVNHQKFPKKAFFIACSIAFLWYLFAWIWFGAPLPNSFLTKTLHQSGQIKIIDWTWFGTLVFWSGAHKFAILLSFFGAYGSFKKNKGLIIFLFGIVIIHFTAYTIKYPFEPYNWYAVPSIFSLLILSAIGLNVIRLYLSRYLQSKYIYAAYAVFLFAIISFSLNFEIINTKAMKSFVNYQEYDRANAGRWVSENTPSNFVVYTSWGNPAYYSKRKVLDGSFLNRKFNGENLIEKYKPEILILQGNPGSTPMNPVFGATDAKDYQVVKVFDKTYSVGMDYFFAVLARKDIVSSIDNVDIPRDLSPYIGNINLGDKFGTVKPSGLTTLFIHPGESNPTTFSFNSDKYMKDYGSESISVNARIDPSVPKEAINRGGANVILVISSGSTILYKHKITIETSFKKNIPIFQYSELNFSIDNNGGPDTDWLLISIK
jgi:hypothetical protein